MVAKRALNHFLSQYGSFENGQIAAYRHLLDAQARRTGQALLTDEGVCYVRQLLVTLRSGRASGAIPLLPHWEEEQLQLWLGDCLLKSFGHRRSQQTAILAAFQKHGWAKRAIANPLEREACETDEVLRERLEHTLKNLNRELVKGTIRFRAEADGATVRWDFCAGDFVEPNSSNVFADFVSH